MTTPHILSVDPGKATGVAIWDEHLTQTLQIDDGRYGFQDWAEHRLQHFDLVVCEDYTITSRTVKSSRQVDALRIIGWLDLRLHARGIPFVLQKNTAKTFTSDDKLKALGWYRGSPGHTDDACRHLFKYLAQHHQTDPAVHGLLMKVASR